MKYPDIHKKHLSNMLYEHIKVKKALIEAMQQSNLGNHVPKTEQKGTRDIITEQFTSATISRHRKLTKAKHKLAD